MGWEFKNEIIDKIPNLKALCLEATGYEWVNCAYCSKKGIAVTNIPHYAINVEGQQPKKPRNNTGPFL